LNLAIKGCGAPRFGSKRKELIIKVRECFVRVNICNQFKLLYDIMKKNMNVNENTFRHLKKYSERLCFENVVLRQ
jgi:hypothetical protein